MFLLNAFSGIGGEGLTKFTIQNVSIKYWQTKYMMLLHVHLQYKMFLLNELTASEFTRYFKFTIQNVSIK